jgi:hypothetical protein
MPADVVTRIHRLSRRPLALTAIEFADRTGVPLDDDDGEDDDADDDDYDPAVDDANIAGVHDDNDDAIDDEDDGTDDDALVALNDANNAELAMDLELAMATEPQPMSTIQTPIPKLQMKLTMHAREPTKKLETTMKLTMQLERTTMLRCMTPLRMMILLTLTQTLPKMMISRLGGMQHMVLERVHLICAPASHATTAISTVPRAGNWEYSTCSTGFCLVSLDQ